MELLLECTDYGILSDLRRDHMVYRRVFHTAIHHAPTQTCSLWSAQDPEPQHFSSLNPDPQHFSSLNPDPQHFGSLNPDPQQFGSLNPDPQHFASLNPDPQHYGSPTLWIPNILVP